MRIDLTQLGPEGIKVSETFEAADLAGGGGSVGDALWEPERVELDAWVRPERRSVRASGTFRAETRAECDRCLKPVLERVSGTYDLRYRWSDAAAKRGARGDDHELHDEDLSLDELAGSVLDTREIALEQIELAAPIQTLCSESCAGLCSSCGADRNLGPCGCTDDRVDPRWEELRRIRMKDEGER